MGKSFLTTIPVKNNNHTVRYNRRNTTESMGVINDISGGALDPEMYTNCGVVTLHHRTGGFCQRGQAVC